MRIEDFRNIILKMLQRNKSYGYAIHKRLMSQGVKVEMSVLYRVLNQMLREGYLESSWDKGDAGPRKKIYGLGSKGKAEFDKTFLESTKVIHEYYRDYLLSLPPKTNPLEIISRAVTDPLKGKGNIAYLSAESSPMNQRMIETLHKATPRSRIYLVRPSSIVMEIPTHLLVLNALVVLDGTHGDIPLKDGFVDLLFVVDFPPEDRVETSLREWHRVIKQNGTLCVLIPTALLGLEDPLTIGDFMEKCEHTFNERDKSVNKDFVEPLLRKLFHEVKVKQVVHLTILQASKPRHQGTGSRKL